MSDHHHLAAEIDPALPLIDADRDRIVQVLMNLVSNAIKYSPRGGHVKVAAGPVRGAVQVSVSDHGEGIPETFMPKLFQRFERYESSPTSRVIGTGLGLPIAHQIVEAHGGRIWAESKLGEGSTFHFTLPSTSLEFS